MAAAATAKRPVGRPRTRNEPRQKKGAYLGIRMPTELKQELEALTAASETRSLSGEAEQRLAQSVALERAVGPDVAKLVYRVFVPFAHRGAIVARATGNKEWIRDPVCFRAAMIDAIEALALAFPGDGMTADDWWHIEQMIRSRFGRSERDSGFIEPDEK